MKFELVLYTYIASTPEQQRLANGFVSSAQPDTLKSCEGVLWLNAAAWLFDLDRARERYDQVLSEAKQWGVQLISIELPDGLVYHIFHESPVDSKEKLEKRIALFFSGTT